MLYSNHIYKDISPLKNLKLFKDNFHVDHYIFYSVEHYNDRKVLCESSSVNHFLLKIFKILNLSDYTSKILFGQMPRKKCEIKDLK